MACCVDFHFDFSSPYGFLAAMKIERALPRGRYRRLLWRPFLLGAVYQASASRRSSLKRRYVLEIDAPRVGRRDGLALKVPAGFPQHSLPAARAFHWIEARARVAEGLQESMVKLRLVTENEQAIAKGVFGLPFIRVDGEPFWGSDRLDDVADRLAA